MHCFIPFSVYYTITVINWYDLLWNIRCVDDAIILMFILLLITDAVLVFSLHWWYCCYRLLTCSIPVHCVVIHLLLMIQYSDDDVILRYCCILLFMHSDLMPLRVTFSPLLRYHCIGVWCLWCRAIVLWWLYRVWFRCCCCNSSLLRAVCFDGGAFHSVITDYSVVLCHFWRYLVHHYSDTFDATILEFLFLFYSPFDPTFLGDVDDDEYILFYHCYFFWCDTLWWCWITVGMGILEVAVERVRRRAGTFGATTVERHTRSPSALWTRSRQSIYHLFIPADTIAFILMHSCIAVPVAPTPLFWWSILWVCKKAFCTMTITFCCYCEYVSCCYSVHCYCSPTCCVVLFVLLSLFCLPLFCSTTYALFSLGILLFVHSLVVHSTGILMQLYNLAD